MFFRWNSGKHSTFRSSFFIVQSNHNHWSDVEELVFIFSRLLRSFKNRNQISLRQGACRSLNFDIWVLTKAVGLKFKVSCLFVPKVLAFILELLDGQWSPPFPCESKGQLNDFMVHAMISRDFSKFSIIVLIFWRKYANTSDFCWEGNGNTFSCCKHWFRYWPADKAESKGAQQSKLRFAFADQGDRRVYKKVE